MYKEKKESRRISPPTDLTMRFGCCSFSACWSKWWSESRSVRGGVNQGNTEVPRAIYIQVQVGRHRYLTSGREFQNAADQGTICESLMVHDTSQGTTALLKSAESESVVAQITKFGQWWPIRREENLQATVTVPGSFDSWAICVRNLAW